MEAKGRNQRLTAGGPLLVAPRSCAAGGGARATAEGGPGAAGAKRQRGPRTESIPRPLRRRKASVAERPLAAARGAAAPRDPLRELQAVVINLERRPDRMDACAARLQARCQGLRFERFVATDGKAERISTEEVATSWHTARNVVYQRQRAVRKGWDDLDTYQERRLALSPGERGCSSSHLRAWRRCLELAGDSDRPLLVLEDDAAPTAEFTQTLSRAMAALPPDAGLLYLGYSQAAEWRREVSLELVEAEYVWTTVAYIIWPACARRFLSRLPIDEPVDNWMAGMAAASEIKAYCVRPKIVLQADAWNVNSDVAHSDEHYWGPCSDIRHSDVLYWGPDHPEARGVGGCLLGADDDSDSEASACEFP